MKKLSAFTLIELSIVIVIIGLIVGGVLVGQDLIRAAQLRSILSDVEKFEAAHNTFRLKYNCEPGDCNTAATFNLGGNGNGNKRLDTNHPSASPELFFYWQHLAKAGFIKGEYTGTTGSGSGNINADIGSNIPESRIDGVGYGWFTYYPYRTSFNPNVGLPSKKWSTLNIGRDTQTSGNRQGPFKSFMINSEVQAIDQKIDDGLVNQGKIRSHINNAIYNISCTTGAAPNYSYVTNPDAPCSLVVVY